MLTAAQIENLSVVGRSSLELLRILPGVVSPDNTAFESVSFGGGANNTQAYTVNGIRSSNNNVSLDGSALIDIGSNSGSAARSTTTTAITGSRRTTARTAFSGPRSPKASSTTRGATSAAPC